MKHIIIVLLFNVLNFVLHVYGAGTMKMKGESKIHFTDADGNIESSIDKNTIPSMFVVLCEFIFCFRASFYSHVKHGFLIGLKSDVDDLKQTCANREGSSVFLFVDKLIRIHAFLFSHRTI